MRTHGLSLFQVGAAILKVFLSQDEPRQPERLHACRPAGWWTHLDKSGRSVYHDHMSPLRSASDLSPLAQDEALLESLLARIAPSAVTVLTVALRFAATHPAELPAGLLLHALQLRGEQNAPVWLEKLGRLLGIQETMSLTGLSKSGLHKAKDEERLFAVRLGGESFDRFPLFQFRAGMVREWIPSLLQSTGNGFPAAHFLTTPRKRLQGRAYIDLLSENEDPTLVQGMLRHAASIGDDARGPDPA